MSSCLCKNAEGAVFPVQVESLEDGVNDAVHALHVDKQTMGRVRRRTSTKQRSIMLVVRSLRHSCSGKLKKLNNSGRSRSNCRTMVGYCFFQRSAKLRQAAWAALRFSAW